MGRFFEDETLFDGELHLTTVLMPTVSQTMFVHQTIVLQAMNLTVMDVTEAQTSQKFKTSALMVEAVDQTVAVDQITTEINARHWGPETKIRNTNFPKEIENQFTRKPISF